MAVNAPTAGGQKNKPLISGPRIGAVLLVAGADLNQRPLGYEPEQELARLCFSML
jgi:hypothetical protein